MYKEGLAAALASFGRKPKPLVFGGDRLSFVWWNTSLSPYGGTKSKMGAANKRKTIKSIIRLVEMNDLVVLGEYQDEYGLSKCLAEANLRLHNLGSGIRYDVFDLNYKCNYKAKNGRNYSHEFHNYLIYNRSSLINKTGSLKEATFNMLGKDHYRVFQRVRFYDNLMGLGDFELFIVHWSMHDGFEGRAEARRKEAAAERIVEQMGLDESAFPYQLVMGDFNCELYEEPFAKLKSSRSRGYSTRNGTLYNPFWACMGDEIGTISNRDNVAFLCDAPFFDSVMVNHRIASDDRGLVLHAKVLEDIEPFLADQHHPLRLVIERRM